MPVIAVDSLDDPRLAAYRNVRDRDLRGRGNAFIAEGATVLANAVPRCRHVIRSVLVAEGKRAGTEPLLADLPPEMPVYVAPAEVMNAVVGFHIHRGVLAHGERTPDPGVGARLDALPGNALVVACFGISNHDNLGGILRNAVAFGADAVLLDPACCDPLYRKAIRVSVGASLICPFARADSDEALCAALAIRDFRCLALAPGAGARIDGLRAITGPVAIMVGAEGPGLPEAALRAGEQVCIAMAPGLDSLNAATATGIALHAVARAMGRL